MKLRYGQASANVLDRSVYKRLGKAEERKDTALTISPVTFAGGETGFLSVISAVNNLAAEGRLARQIQTTILLPPGTQEEVLRRLEDQVREAALLCSLHVTGGHTEVTSAVTRPVVITAAAGDPFAADVHEEAGESLIADRDMGAGDPFRADIHERVGKSLITGSNMGAGDLFTANIHAEIGKSSAADASAAAGNQLITKASAAAKEGDGNWHILIAGAAGMEGTCLLARERNRQLAEHFPDRLIEAAANMRNDLCVAEAARQICLTATMPLEERRDGIPRHSMPACGRNDGSQTNSSQNSRSSALPVMVNASDGGIFAALWNLSERAGRVLGRHGFTIDLLKIPVRQETIEIADFLGLNPYALASEGCLAAVVRNPREVLAALTAKGIMAVDVGVLTKDNNKCLRNGEEVRFLDAPAPDALAGLLA